MRTMTLGEISWKPIHKRRCCRQPKDSRVRPNCEELFKQVDLRLEIIWKCRLREERANQIMIRSNLRLLFLHPRHVAVLKKSPVAILRKGHVAVLRKQSKETSLVLQRLDRMTCRRLLKCSGHPSEAYVN